LLASDTAEKPRVKPSQESSERTEPPVQPIAQPTAPDAALPPELLSDEMHRAAAERNAPWHVRHANRIRLAALVGITGGLAGLALYGWNTLRPSELDKLQITLPARTSAGFVEPAAVPPPPAVQPPAAVAPTATVQPKVQPPPPVAPTATVQTKVQPAPPTRTAVVATRAQPASPPQARVETAIPVRPSGNRTSVTHTRGADASTAAAAVAVPEKSLSEKQPAKSNCVEAVAALGLCK
jgi:hypothetical protein